MSKTNSPLVLSVDIGTSGIRATVYDGRGREVPGTSASMARGFTFTPDGGAETDAVELAAQTESVITRCLAMADARRIEAVTVASFWHGLLGIDAQGAPVTPIYGWADTRAGREAADLRLRWDERATHCRTGCRFHPGYWPAKLVWLRAHRAELFARVARWISPGDHLLSRWCGVVRTSVSMASATGLFDQRGVDWDSELLAAIGLDRAHFSSLEDEAEVLRFGPEYDGRWPQLADARIFPAIGDGAANNIGVGCITREKAALMIGTSGAMRVIWNGAPPDDVPPGLWLYRADRQRVVLGGALSDGGGLFRWMKETLSLTDEPADLENKLAQAEPDGHGLTVLPFWAGERSTGWNSSARGGIYGITMHTAPIDILRAGLEAWPIDLRPSQSNWAG